jgi:hypothetical protein
MSSHWICSKEFVYFINILLSECKLISSGFQLLFHDIREAAHIDTAGYV